MRPGRARSQEAVHRGSQEWAAALMGMIVEMGGMLAVSAQTSRPATLASLWHGMAA